MTSEQAFERMLQQHRARIREAIGTRTLVKPQEVYADICPARTYDAHIAETVCGHLAGLGFTRAADGAWVRQA
jgi:hypothetical protein